MEDAILVLLCLNLNFKYYGVDTILKRKMKIWKKQTLKDIKIKISCG